MLRSARSQQGPAQRWLVPLYHRLRIEQYHDVLRAHFRIFLVRAALLSALLLDVLACSPMSDGRLCVAHALLCRTYHRNANCLRSAGELQANFQANRAPLASAHLAARLPRLCADQLAVDVCQIGQVRRSVAARLARFQHHAKH